MAEVAFAKTFLASLDPRPIKLSGEHVEDPKNFPSRPPFILPRMPKPMSQTPTAPTPGHERSITVHIKSLRNPPLDIKLLSQPIGTTSVLDIKASIAQQTGIPIDKMKIIHSKRPLQDSKVLKELLLPAGGDGSNVSVLEFSVMVIGGAAAIVPPPAAAAAAPPTAEAEESLDAMATTTATEEQEEEEEEEGQVLEKDAFWAHLTGFLEQQLKSQDKAQELSSFFRSSWQTRTSSS